MTEIASDLNDEADRASSRVGLSVAVEDYAKAIYKLQNRSGRPVTTNALAGQLGVTPGSASAMLKRLDRLELVRHVPYHGVEMTPRGAGLALEVIRHHRLLELYLAESLGLGWDRVHAEAEVLEHVLSDELEELIDAKLGHPTRDPHGDPIPTRDGRLDEAPTQSLDALEPGTCGSFARVSDADSAMLNYLRERDIVPGVRLEVVDRQPFGGPLFVRVAAEVHALGGDLARAMRIEVER